ncbi:TetR/AcrR family transcriptional regulator [Nocardioides dubius]|uniref:TetR/AcrR family transcriptional regulator n=1 Tax=Nocardioides dubius TaxID=317019 RepID=A0ABP4EDF4_9ACTN
MPEDPPASRQERRKAQTRARIVAAADQLFQERGYVETSIEEIATAADVAVRTIYLHFESKAAIMLSYFDEWTDAFIAAVRERPVDEPVRDAVAAALRAMGDAGWADRVEGGDARPHPLVEYIGSGPVDIAGHVLHRWMNALSTLTDDAAARMGGSGPAIDPHARAVSVFLVWISAMSAAREKQRGTVPDDVTGLTMLDRIASGDL